MTELTTVDKMNIQRLYDEGYALARIRHMLGLNVTLQRVLTVATRARARRR